VVSTTTTFEVPSAFVTDTAVVEFEAGFMIGAITPANVGVAVLSTDWSGPLFAVSVRLLFGNDMVFAPLTADTSNFSESADDVALLYNTSGL
jgi:hypothetical protein